MAEPTPTQITPEKAQELSGLLPILQKVFGEFVDGCTKSLEESKKIKISQGFAAIIASYVPEEEKEEEQQQRLEKTLHL